MGALSFFSLCVAGSKKTAIHVTRKISSLTDQHMYGYTLAWLWYTICRVGGVYISVLSRSVSPKGTPLRPGHFYLVLTMIRCMHYKHFWHCEECGEWCVRGKGMWRDVEECQRAHEGCKGHWALWKEAGGDTAIHNILFSQTRDSMKCPRKAWIKAFHHILASVIRPLSEHSLTINTARPITSWFTDCVWHCVCVCVFVYIITGCLEE